MGKPANLTTAPRNSGILRSSFRATTCRIRRRHTVTRRSTRTSSSAALDSDSERLRARWSRSCSRRSSSNPKGRALDVSAPYPGWWEPQTPAASAPEAAFSHSAHQRDGRTRAARGLRTRRAPSEPGGRSVRL